MKGSLEICGGTIWQITHDLLYHVPVQSLAQFFSWWKSFLIEFTCSSKLNGEKQLDLRNQNQIRITL